MIELINICKSYGNKKVLDNINLTVSQGKIVGLVGKNGAGKSTLLSIMSGALKKDSGRVIYHNRELEDRNLIAKYAAFVPQENPLIEDLSVKDNLKLWYSGTKTKLNDLLKSSFIKEMGIDKFINEKVSNLSGGMKKRLSIACALANNSPILLMDEPAAALDLVVKEDVRNYILSYRDRGGTVVISSHEKEDFSICDELYLVKNGKLTKIDKNLNLNELAELIKEKSN